MAQFDSFPAPAIDDHDLQGSYFRQGILRAGNHATLERIVWRVRGISQCGCRWRPRKSIARGYLLCRFSQQNRTDFTEFADPGIAEINRFATQHFLGVRIGQRTAWPKNAPCRLVFPHHTFRKCRVAGR